MKYIDNVCFSIKGKYIYATLEKYKGVEIRQSLFSKVVIYRFSYIVQINRQINSNTSDTFDTSEKR